MASLLDSQLKFRSRPPHHVAVLQGGPRRDGEAVRRRDEGIVVLYSIFFNDNMPL